MKIKGLDDITKFIDNEIMANQLKWGFYIIVGTIILIFTLWSMR